MNKFEDIKSTVIEIYKSQSKKILDDYWVDFSEFMEGEIPMMNEMYMMCDAIENFVCKILENKAKLVYSNDKMLSLAIDFRPSKEVAKIFIKYKGEIKDSVDKYSICLAVKDELYNKETNIDLVGAVDNATNILSNKIKEELEIFVHSFWIELNKLVYIILSEFRLSEKEIDKGMNFMQKRITNDLKKYNKEVANIENSYIEELLLLQNEVNAGLRLLNYTDLEICQNEELKLSRENRKKNIYDYKEMNKLAVSKGFEYVRSNGDHDIYKHKKTGRVTVIPQRTLSLGLSLSIQKQIMNAC